MVRALGLTEAVLGDASDRIVAAWRVRAARMYPSDFADCPEPVRYALLAALCWTRQAELVDGLVELLIGLIHRINARAERRVEKELTGELANVGNDRDTCKTGQGLIFADTGNAWAPVVRACYLLPPRLCRLLISQLRRVNVPRARQPDIRRIPVDSALTIED